MEEKERDDNSYLVGIKRHRQDRHEKLLKETAAVFAKLGIAHVSMDKVAKEVGVTKVVLYRYFKSKDDLINLILSQFVDKLLDSNDSDFKWGRKVVAENLVIVRENQDASLLLMHHTIHDPKFGHHYKRLHGDLVESTIKRINNDFDINESNVINARFFSECLCTFILDAMRGWVVSGEPIKDREFVRWAVQSMAGLGKAWSEPPK